MAKAKTKAGNASTAGAASLSPDEKAKLFISLLNDSDLSYFAGKSKKGRFYRTLRVASKTYWLDSEETEKGSGTYLISLGKEKEDRVETKDSVLAGFSDDQLEALKKVLAS